MDRYATSSLDVRAFGAARADLSEIAEMRKHLPEWAPSGTPGHFLKHADEQTVVAVAAVDQAVKSGDIPAEERKNCVVIAAPRFIGRLGGTASLERYGRGGGPAISPHLIPQHSLHSVSGALSILLASHEPNFGVGGGVSSLTDCFFAALTVPRSAREGNVWVVSTAWDAEPVIDRRGTCVNHPVCYSAVVALARTRALQSCGRLKLVSNAIHACGTTGTDLGSPATVVELSNVLAALPRGNMGCQFLWRLPWGATLELEVHPAVQRLSKAA